MRHLKRLLLSFVSLIGLCACGPLSTPPKNLDFQSRLAHFPSENLPLEKPVEINWNAHAIPYIVAQNDKDAAFALGLTHAHLRLGQMEILKRIAHGRISEMAGPATVKLDEALRHLGFWRSSKDVLKSMPDHSRQWLEAYVDGINHYKQNLSLEPHEFKVLGIQNSEAWSAEDSLTIGRLSGTDVNWMSWFSLLQVYDQPGYQAYYNDLLSIGEAGAVSIAPDGDALKMVQENKALETLSTILTGFSRSGSNSVAVSGSRTKSGKPIIANDPHLGFFLPNAWVTIGLKSPSYHGVGMMVSGIPVFGFGRTPNFAWGGTNMRALNSDLVDVSDLPSDAFIEESHLIKVRFWPDHVFQARTTKYGPVMSDTRVFPSPEGKQLAVKWVGHNITDEITALLDANRAQNYDQFRTAMADFAIPAQNFVYADKDTIAITLATQLAKRDADHQKTLIHTPDAVDRYWSETLDATTLPNQVNPTRGFVASANNRPVEMGHPLGYFFAPDERVRRLIHLAGARQDHDIESLKALQSDTKSLMSLDIKNALSDRFDLPNWMDDWDAAYNVNSREALQFEIFIAHFAPEVFNHIGQDALYEKLKDRITMRGFLLSYIESLPAEDIEIAYKDALEKANTLPKDQNWGTHHKLKVQHLLGNIPILGKAYRQNPISVSGSQETILKTAHPTTAQKHTVTYGSQSRHISDLSDLDANYFVLFGGNDGWIGSDKAYDQVKMWQDGTYIQMPLRLENLPQSFKTKLVLKR